MVRAHVREPHKGSIMVAKNDITGDSIQTKTATQSYLSNYDNIFRKPNPREVQDAINEDEEFKRIEKNNRNNGGVAHLGERLLCKQ